MAGRNRFELKHYWEDGVTIECRYFSSKEQAEKFAKDNGYCEYVIESLI